MEKKTYDFSAFTEIVRQLRLGCPWDSKQTHQSLKKYLMEESNEVLEGIDIYETTGDSDNLCEELGDVLFQVLIHSVIAEEEGIFTIEDVIQGVSEKMVRRHPNVFAADQYPDNKTPTWEEIKAQEKLEKKNQKKYQMPKNLDKKV